MSAAEQLGLEFAEVNDVLGLDLAYDADDVLGVGDPDDVTAGPAGEPYWLPAPAWWEEPARVARVRRRAAASRQLWSGRAE